jgi:hypothetical protein
LVTKKSANRFFFGIQKIHPCTVMLFLEPVWKHYTGQCFNTTLQLHISPTQLNRALRGKLNPKKRVEIADPEARLCGKTNATPQK